VSWSRKPGTRACLVERGFERDESLARDHRDERVLVGEVAVEGGARHAQGGADAAQGQGVDALAMDDPDRLVHEGAAQVAMVVATARFPRRTLWC